MGKDQLLVPLPTSKSTPTTQIIIRIQLSKSAQDMTIVYFKLDQTQTRLEISVKLPNDPHIKHTGRCRVESASLCISQSNKKKINGKNTKQWTKLDTISPIVHWILSIGHLNMT